MKKRSAVACVTAASMIVLMGGVTAVIATSAHADTTASTCGTPPTTTLSLTAGQSQTFTVPATTTTLEIDAIGGAGGSVGSAAGGQAAEAVEVAPVAPGDQIAISVGSPGTVTAGGTSSARDAGGSGNGTGSGGGSATVVTDTTTNTVLTVAAGGGGAAKSAGGSAGDQSNQNQFSVGSVGIAYGGNAGTDDTDDGGQGGSGATNTVGSGGGGSSAGYHGESGTGGGGGTNAGGGGAGYAGGGGGGSGAGGGAGSSYLQASNKGAEDISVNPTSSPAGVTLSWVQVYSPDSGSTTPMSAATFPICSTGPGTTQVRPSLPDDNSPCEGCGLIVSSTGDNQGTLTANAAGGSNGVETAEIDASEGFLDAGQTFSLTISGKAPSVIDTSNGLQIAVGDLSYSDGQIGLYGVSPTGTVSFSADGSPISECQQLPVVAGDGSDGYVGPSSADCQANLGPGDHSVLVSYSGDDNYAASSATETVDVSGSSTATPTPTATTSAPVTTSPSPTPTVPVTGTTAPAANPTMSIRVSSKRGTTKYGWYSTPVTVTFTCRAGSAPLSSCPSPVTVTKSGKRIMVKRTARDSDGGAVSETAGPFMIDRIKPTANVHVRSDGAVVCNGYDKLSGLAHLRCFHHGVAGGTKWTAVATDKAGNVTRKSIVVTGT